MTRFRGEFLEGAREAGPMFLQPLHGRPRDGGGTIQPRDGFKEGVIVTKRPPCGEDILFLFMGKDLGGAGFAIEVSFEGNIRAPVRRDPVDGLITVQLSKIMNKMIDLL